MYWDMYSPKSVCLWWGDRRCCQIEEALHKRDEGGNLETGVAGCPVYVSEL